MRKLILSAAAVCFFAVVGQAQTAAEVIAKHQAAIGGKEALAKTISVYAETSTSVMGNDAPGKIYILNTKGYKSEMEIMGSTMTQCISTNGGWAVNPMAGGSPEDMPAEQANSMKSNMYIGGVMANYPENGANFELAGAEKVGEVDTYKLVLSTAAGEKVYYYIDKANFYLVRNVATGQMMGQEMTVTSDYSDFKKLNNGVVLPQVTAIDLGQFQLETRWTNIELNKAIDESIFKKP